jgi:YVTN family beta-propeller protein
MKRVIVAITLILTWCSVAMGEFNKTVYVVNGTSETMSKIDLPGGVVHEDVTTLGSIPNDILIRGDRAYVVNSGSSDLYVIDLGQDVVTSVIDLGPGNNPWSGAFLDDSTMYVSNWLTATVSRVNIYSGSITDIFGVGTGPEGVLIVDGRLYVANSGWNGGGYDPGSVSVIDVGEDSIVATVPVGLNPQDLVMDSRGEIEVVCTGDYFSRFGTIYKIDSATDEVTDSVTTGGSPGRAALTSLGLLYMAAGGWFGSGEIYAYNTIGDVLIHGSNDPITVGVGATDVAADNEGHFYATSFSENEVEVFDVPDDSIMTYTVGSGPVAIAVREEPWIDVVSNPDRRFFHAGDDITYSVAIAQRGASEDTVSAVSVLVLPDRGLYGGNPILGPYVLSLQPGEGHGVERTDSVPPAAPPGRYVLFSVVSDLDTRRTSVGTFWFQVLP